MDKLTGLDYVKMPFLELMQHPDYSPHALRIMARICTMETEEIEKIDLLGGGK